MTSGTGRSAQARQLRDIGTRILKVIDPDEDCRPAT
jgi:hypothetical protein